MKFAPLFVSLLAAASFAAPIAHADTIGFEDISITGCCTFPVDGYHGMNWSGSLYAGSSWAIAEQSQVIFPGSQAHSGVNYAWSNGGTDLTMAGAAFNISSLWVRDGYGASTVTFTGSSAGTTTFSFAVNTTTDYQLVNLNFTGIDNLAISSGGTNILLDDITVSAVPEPESFAMMLAGLGLLGFMRRQSKKSA